MEHHCVFRRPAALGRTVRQAQPIAFRLRPPLAVAAAVLLLLGGSLQTGATGFPEIEGWTPAGPIATYTPDNLWDHINGAAELFLRYDFQTLHTAEVAAGDLVVTVAIYRMGSHLDAFGIFHRELPPGAAQLPIGAGALVSPPYQGLLVKDRYYIKVDAFKGEIDPPTGASLLAAIARALPGEDGPPPELVKLPAQGRVVGSAGFARGAFLGFEELDRSLHARYDRGSDGDFTLFVVLPGSEQRLDLIWQRLAATWIPLAHKSGPVLARKLPHGLAGLMRTPDGIVGVAGVDSKQELLARLDGFAKESDN